MRNFCLEQTKRAKKVVKTIELAVQKLRSGYGKAVKAACNNITPLQFQKSRILSIFFPGPFDFIVGSIFFLIIIIVKGSTI